MSGGLGGACGCDWAAASIVAAKTSNRIAEQRLIESSWRRAHGHRKERRTSTGNLCGAPQSLAYHQLNRSAQAHGRQVLWAYPSHLAHVAAGPGLAGNQPAQIVDQHIVILCPSFPIGKDAVEDVQHLAGFDLQTGLLQCLAAHTVAKFLA